MSEFYNNAIFWIDTGKISPNPYQPRREFNEDALRSLADSIRQYGVLQPLVVTRIEIEKEDGGIATEYELIAGERRLRASRLAGLSQIPALIREKEESDKAKLEIAIIENLQREDLNPVERAEAFQRLVDEFNFKHAEVAKKIGKSREYVSNSLRILALPGHMKDAIKEGAITEGHSRPLLMLSDRPEEQEVLFKEITYKKLTVRDTESIARRIAHDKVRKKVHENPEILEMEKKLSEVLGTRVHIEKNSAGGKILIDFFSEDDVRSFLSTLEGDQGPKMFSSMMEDSSEASTLNPDSAREVKPDDNSDSDPDSQDEQGPNTLSSAEEGLEEHQWKGDEEGEPHIKDNIQPEDETPDEAREDILETEESLGKEDDFPVKERDIEEAEFDSVAEKEKEDTDKESNSDDGSDDDLYSLRNFSI